jgi:hypothetical protein
MSDELAPYTAEKQQNKPRGKPLAKGFDERRWLKGRPKVPKDKLALFDGLIWEILSEEVEHPITKEKVDRLRLMLRSMTTNKNQQDKLLDRVFGKVQERVDVTTNGESLKPDIQEVYDSIVRKLGLDVADNEASEVIPTKSE